MPRLGNIIPNDWPEIFKRIRITEANRIESPTKIREEFRNEI